MSQFTVLIVDDSLEDCATFRRYLTHNSTDKYRIEAVQTGKNALEHLRHETPDCILLDYRLPDMDGLTVLNILNAESESKVARFPVVMMTGHSSTLQAVHSMKQGVEDYLIKGAVTKEVLSRAVDNAIEKHHLHLQVEAQ